MNIYLKWVPKEKIITTNLWSSELSKLISNAFLAQRISSINSVTALCENTGADIKEVAEAIKSDHRIGEYFLEPGPGFGGSCFKKDILNLVYICDHYGLKEISSYWEKVVHINSWQSERILNIIIEKLFGSVSDKIISILGLEFKANTNDIRESPAIKICKGLLEEGCNLQIYDPKVNQDQIENALDFAQNPDFAKNKWTFSKSILDSANSADAIVVLTEWNEFRNIDWELLSSNMRRPAWLFDTRSICNLKEAKKNGLNIWRVGADSNMIN